MKEILKVPEYDILNALDQLELIIRDEQQDQLEIGKSSAKFEKDDLKKKQFLNLSSKVLYKLLKKPGR